MTEHLGFEQVFRERGTVDGNELLLDSTAMAMNELSENLFARAALSAQHHRRIRRSDATREGDRLPEGRGDAETAYEIAVSDFGELAGSAGARLPSLGDGVKRATREDI